MTRFKRCLTYVLRHEGGYVDHPSDPGGATNFGITRKTLARWRRVSPWWKLEKIQVRRIKSDEVAAIYLANYWRPCKAAYLPAGLDYAVFDFAVNSGPSRANKYLQAIVGTKKDGVLGPNSLNAIRQKMAEKGVSWLVAKLCDRRLGFLRRLSTFSIFGNGWTRRVNDVRRISLAMIVSKRDQATQTLPKTNNQRKLPMQILSGYKTYIIAIAMLIAGVGQMVGVELPGFDGQTSGQLVFEALAILFLRRGIKNEVSNA